jgi:beta-lactamase regulating signal transducer with metallopeptidase domain/predicted  nucleic acid-binding Zn-ribbon protein
MTLLLLLARVTVVLAGLIAAAALLRRASAAARHRVWSAGLVLTLALPLLTFVLPGIAVPVPAQWAGMRTAPASIDGDRRVSLDARAAATTEGVAAERVPDPATAETGTGATPLPLTDPRSEPSVPRWTATTIAVIVWLFGAFMGLCAIALSHVRAARLVRSGQRMTDERWTAQAAATARAFGLARVPRLVTHPDVAAPMAGGVFRGTVFLPAAAAEWDEDRRQVVLAHEFAHLAARDPLRLCGARLALACYWAHPLAWIAIRQAAKTRELACDESVLAAGTQPSTYARVLLEFASARTPFTPALPMAQRSHLEHRLMTILHSTSRPSATRVGALAIAAVAALTLGAAAAHPFAAPAVTFDAVTFDTAPTDAAPIAADLPAACVQDRMHIFNGSISVNGQRETTMAIGYSESEQLVLRSFDGMRVCFVAGVTREERDRGGRRPSEVLRSSPRVTIASESGGRVQSLEIENGRSTFRSNGETRPMDANVEAWRDALMAVIDTTWDIGALRGRVSSLRGEISSIRGRESSLRGQISSIQGEESSLRGEISSIEGRESSLRGEISSIRGYESSLRGQISSEQGAISSLEAVRMNASAAERKRIDDRIAEHRREIRDIESRIDRYDADARVAEVEKAIAAWDTKARVADVERRIDRGDTAARVAQVNKEIASLDVRGKVAAIEREIESLDADRKVADLERQQDAAVDKLKAAQARIR